MSKEFWPKEKAEKHIKFAGLLVIISGIFTIVFSIKRFIYLATSAFIIPYLFNLLDVLFGIFEIYTGIALRKAKIWARWAVFFIVAIKIIFDFFLDQNEAMIMVVALFYFIYVLKNSSAGWLFKIQSETGKSFNA